MRRHLVLFTLGCLLAANLASAQSTPTHTPTTWGHIKAMYGISDTKGDPQGSAMTDDWLYATYREICYALSISCYKQGYWGFSTRTLTNGMGTWFAGDWDYLKAGTIGYGGQCKTFASTIVNRATGGRYTLPSGYSYAHGDIGYCRPGDVIQKDVGVHGTQHTAIVVAILATDGNGKATLIDVIDSNYIASNTIARHVLPYSNDLLTYYKVW